jgi:dephospho-CoA kinase
MKVLGLTGGIASGKSTVAKMFVAENIPLIDCDKIAKELLHKGTLCYDEVVDYFSKEILLTNGDINRRKLAKIVFSNPNKRNRLNEIVHPRVKDEVFKLFMKYKEERKELVILDVPLLYETEFHTYTDETIVVYCSYENQVERLMLRDNIDEEYAEMKIEAQMSLETKKEKADYVIDNSFSILDTKREFLRILKELEV